MQKRRPRGRPRDIATDRAIYETAWVLLKREGFLVFSLDELAKRSGVSRTSLYRRWPNKIALVFSLLQQHFEELRSVPETGSTHDDLLFLLRRIVSLHHGPLGRVFLQFLGACRSTKKEMTAYRKTFLLPERRVVQTILTAGILRGEIQPQIDKTLVADALLGPLLFALAHGDKITNRAIEDLVSLVLRGIRAKPPANV